MTHLQLLKGCELHVHAVGCLYPDDLLTFGRDHYHDIDWSLFIERHQTAYGWQPDPVQLFDDVVANGRFSPQQFHKKVVYSQADSGDFGRFMAKIAFVGCLYAHWRLVLAREAEIINHIIARHCAEGIDYIEYRAGGGRADEDPTGFYAFHLRHARAIQAASGNGLTSRYLASLPRATPLLGYEIIQQLLDNHPELISTIVGLDFCAVEEGYPPATVRAFFQRLHEDNRRRPDRALQVAYHVGESFFDKSLESAIRWCHEVAAMGAKRLGHAIALGLDPAVAISRRPQAHVAELASERLAQIRYDLAHRDGLAAYGVVIDAAALEHEGEQLMRLEGDRVVKRPYSPARLQAIRHRQDYVLDQLAQLGTVIEICPTSNLRIGGVPSPAVHPLHRFLRSNVNLVIAADDPGLFNASLADEIDWVLANTQLNQAALLERLGDPRRFRFGQQRNGCP